MSVEKFARLKSQIEELKASKNKAQGVLDSMMKDLKRKFSCQTVKEAKALAAKKRKEAEAAEEKFNTALAEFEEEWKDVLAELEDED